ncbi:MAG: hypothetical protein J5930_12420 [Treponema sp.]|nr:hypothetical protein [Treponema sp.]
MEENEILPEEEKKNLTAGEEPVETKSGSSAESDIPVNEETVVSQEIVDTKEDAAEKTSYSEDDAGPEDSAGSDDETDAEEETDSDDVSPEDNLPAVQDDDEVMRITADEVEAYSREMVRGELRDIAAEKKLPEKKVPFKKLPPLLRRSYTEKGFKRKVLKHIFIPEDRELIAGLFQKGLDPKKPDRLSIPQDVLFTKKEVSRYKYIANEIKGQKKSRIKMIPLIAVASIIVGAVAAVVTFKNPLAKKGLISVFESIFKAKTDIASVDIRILDSSVTIRGLQVGNKNSVMKNLFEIDKIQADFNLVQLLRKKFVAENLEASGIAWNTDRTYSCYIPHDEEKNDSPFVREVKTRANNAIEDLKMQAYDLLGGSDVESIIANARSNIHTPEVTKQAISDTQALIEKWKEKPAELQVEVESFAASVKNLQTINVTSFNIQNPDDVAALRENLKKITSAIEQGKSLTNKVTQVVEEVKTDAVFVNDMVVNVAGTVKSDYDYIVDRLTTITGTIANLDRLLLDALDTVGYNMLGEYYPYVEEAIAYAQQLKNNPKPEKKKKTIETKWSKRMEGTDFWYSQNYPSFLIQNVRAQGTGFDARITELTNNQDVRYIPTKGSITLDILNTVHKAEVTVDARTGTRNHLVAADYKGSGFNAAIDGTRFATKSGVPSIDGNAIISLSGTADPTGFTAQGSLALDPVRLYSDGFPNDFVTKYYNIGLAAVTDLNMGFDVGYSKTDGLYLKLTGNYGTQFINALKASVLELGKDAKNAAIKRLEQELNNSNNEYVAKAKEFLGIEGDIDLQNMKLSDVQKILEKKRVEIENRLKEEANKAVTEAKKQAESFVQEKTQEVTNQLNETLSNTFSSVLGTDSSSSDKAAENVTDRIKNLGQGLFKKP